MLFYTLSLGEEQKNKFEQIYERYHELMLKKAKRMLFDQMEAEDVIHISFLRILDYLDQIDITDNYAVRAFLLTIVENCCIDYIRKKRREDHLSWDEVQEYDMPVSDKDSVFTQVEIKLVRESMRELPPLYREVMNLKYVNDLDNKTIAKLLGIEEASVRKRISRGKEMLKNKMIKGKK